MFSNKISLDPILTSKITLAQSGAFFVDVAFPVPTSKEQLFEFLHHQGNSFKANALNIINEFIIWITQQQLITNGHQIGVLEGLKQKFEYKDNSSAVTLCAFPLYSEGIPLLNNINKLIKCDDIPLYIRRNIISQLILDLSVCDEDIKNSIWKAYRKLVQDPKIELAVIFRELLLIAAENTLNSGILRVGNPKIANEICKRLFDCVADDFGIPKIGGDYTQNKPFDYIHYFAVLFPEQIYKTVDSTNILNCIFDNLCLDEVQKEYNNNVKFYEYLKNKINLYGHDDQLNFNDVFNQSALKYDQYVLNAQARYYLLLSFQKRLQNSGYFNIDVGYKEIPFGTFKIYIYQNYPLEQSYVFNQEFYEPFITFAFRQICNGNSQFIDSIIDNDQRIELYKHFFKILSDEFLALQNAKLDVNDYRIYIKNIFSILKAALRLKSGSDYLDIYRSIAFFLPNCTEEIFNIGKDDLSQMIESADDFAIFLLLFSHVKTESLAAFIKTCNLVDRFLINNESIIGFFSILRSTILLDNFFDKLITVININYLVSKVNRKCSSIILSTILSTLNDINVYILFDQIKSNLAQIFYDELYQPRFLFNQDMPAGACLLKLCVGNINDLCEKLDTCPPIYRDKLLRVNPTHVKLIIHTEKALFNLLQVINKLDYRQKGLFIELYASLLSEHELDAYSSDSKVYQSLNRALAEGFILQYLALNSNNRYLLTNLINSDYLALLTKNIIRFECYLNYIPSEIRLSLLKCFEPAVLKTFIRSGKDLNLIMSYLMDFEREIFIDHFFNGLTVEEEHYYSLNLGKQTDSDNNNNGFSHNKFGP